MNSCITWTHNTQWFLNTAWIMMTFHKNWLQFSVVAAAHMIEANRWIWWVIEWLKTLIQWLSQDLLGMKNRAIREWKCQTWLSHVELFRYWWYWKYSSILLKRRTSASVSVFFYAPSQGVCNVCTFYKQNPNSSWLHNKPTQEVEQYCLASSRFELPGGEELSDRASDIALALCKAAVSIGGTNVAKK